jgi:anti-sigma-K factor RskA
MSEQDRDPHAMIGAYVADALDDDERTAFEQHLAGCESCRREVAEFTETLGELSRLTESPPPAALRASVLTGIATVRSLPPEEPRPEPAPAVPVGTQATSPAPVDDLAARRQRRVRRVLIGLAAAALVAVVALGGWVAVLVEDQRAQQVASQQVTELLTAPDAKVYATELNGAPVSYVVSRERNQALLVGTDVRSLGADKVYQVWTLVGEDATSQGLMDGGDSVAHWFGAPIGTAEAMAVTVEPAGGSPTPSTEPLAVVKL